MRLRHFGLSLTLATFVGCGADPTSSGDAPAIGSVTAAAASCQSYVGTIDEQVQAGRAYEQDTAFFIWTLPAYYATGSKELIGSSPTQTVTLYPEQGGFTTNAALCQPSQCGDGVLESPVEECDGSLFPPDVAPAGSAPACAQFSTNYGSGNVKCGADCQYDLSDCKATVCGKGKAEGDEVCDGQDVRGNTCQDDLGDGLFTGGQLKCKSDCSGYDVSSCIGACGNGVLDPGEDCDGKLLSSDFAGKTCASFTNPAPAFPFANTLPYVAGPLPCDNHCKVNTNFCASAPGCYYVYTASRTLSIACH
jgi:hypothetical protein